MTTRRMDGPVLGQALWVAGTLDGDGRAALRVALTGLVTETVPLELVPVAEPAVRRRLRDALEPSLRAQLDRLRSSGARLGRLLPGAGLAPDGPLPWDTLGPRAAAALARAGWASWSVLLDQPVRTVLGLGEIGPQAAVGLLGSCFDRSASAVVEAWASDPAAGDLGIVLRRERVSGAEPILEALLERSSADGPRAAAEAAGRLLRSHAPWALHPGEALEAVREAAGDERSRLVLAELCSRRGARPTAGELAVRLGVSGTRVLQLRRQAEARVRAALATSAPSLRWLVATVTRRLGSVTTNEAAFRLLAHLGVRDRSAADLALWLAGPYEEVPGRPGWLATDPRSLLAATSASLQMDGGVRPLADLATELEVVGLRAEMLEGWLASSGASVIHDLAVLVTGPLADAVEGVLDAHGSARSLEEIAADLARAGREVEPAALARLGRHRRFRAAGGTLALAAWQREPAEGSGREEPRPRDEGGGRPGGTLGSVRDLAGPGAPAPRPGEDRLWLCLRVDPELLRGVEATVPTDLVEGLGMAPRSRRTFASRFGPITLSYDAPLATRGPVRAVALAAGARSGDVLQLGFARSGEVTVALRRSAELGRAGHLEAGAVGEGAAGQANATTDTATEGAR